MIKYNINLKTIIPVLSLILVLTIFVSPKSELTAQIPPKTAIYPVGAAQTPGGPPVAPYDPATSADVGFLLDAAGYLEGLTHGYPDQLVPPVSAISCQFPPMIETSNSTAMVVYKKEELGLNGPATISKMRFSSLYFPFYYDAAIYDQIEQYGMPYRLPYDRSLERYNWPYNAARQFYRASGDGAIRGYYGQGRDQSLTDPVGDPTPVEIGIKNGAEFTERGNQPVDKSFPSSQGGVKVYDGYYDPLDNEQGDPSAEPDMAIKYPETDGWLWWLLGYGVVAVGTEEINDGGDNEYGEPMAMVGGSDLSNTTGNKGFNVTIPFNVPFKYTGGDITVAFVNPAERRGIKADIGSPIISFSYDLETGAAVDFFDAYNAGAIHRQGLQDRADLPATYRFRCYTVNDADVGGAYLGPKFQVGSQIAPKGSYWDQDIDSIYRDLPGTNYGLSLNYFDPGDSGNTYNTPEMLAQYSVDPDNAKPSEYINPYSSTELTYSLPAPSPFLYSDDEPGSIKPVVGFDINVQSLVTSRFESGADFKTSTQTIYVPGSTPLSADDYQQVVGEFTIYADSNTARLSLMETSFNLSGTNAGLGTIRLSLYRDISSTGKGDITTSELINTGTVPDNTTTWYLPISGVGDYKLNAGENRFFFVFNLDENKIVCQAPMSITITEFVLGNREFVDTDQLYTIALNRTANRTLAITPVNIVNSNGDSRSRQVCWDDNVAYQMITLDAGTVIGKHSSIEWSYSTDNAQTGTALPGTQGLTVVTVPLDQDVTNYSCRVIYESACPAIKDNEVGNITFESEIESVDFSYNGKLPHDDYGIFNPGVIQGDFLDFTATAVIRNNLTVPVYTGEISSDNGNSWQVVGNSRTLSYVVSAGLYGTQKLRVTVSPDPAVCACRAIVSSKEFSFYVRPQKIEFNFVNNLPAYRMLCANDTITLNVTYSGTVDERNSGGEKNGERLYINGQLATHRVLKLVNTDRTVLGAYRYRVKARVFDPSIDLAPYGKDTLTTTCVVDAYPMLEVFQQPQSNNYITPGVPVMLLVETSLIEDESPYQSYQGYKHTVNGDIRLTDNTYRFGSTSNQLVLLAPTNTNMTNALSREVYTFNGEYYYLQITGPCNTITTDNKIYVLPSEDLQLITDAQNAVVCELGEDVTYTVKANDAQGIADVQYQGYIDGVIATDGGAVSGSQTPTLTIAPLLDGNTKVYCEVSATVFGVATTINSNEAGVEYSYVQNLETTSYINDVALLINLKWETNDLEATSTVDIYLNDNSGVTEELTQGVDMSTVRSHQITIPLDDRFALLLIDNPEILNILVEISNECGSMVSEQTSISVKDVVIEPAAPADIDDSHNADAFDILPNPVNDIVTIGFTSNAITHTTIDICDLSGKTIATLFAGDCQKNYNQLHFNLNDLNIATGTYIIRISNSSGTKSKHFVFAK